MKFKRLLAVILGAMMIMSCFSFTANAQEATNSVTPIALNSAYGTWVSGCNTTEAIAKCGWTTKHYDYATETFYRRFTAPDKSVSDQTGNNTAYFYQDYSGTASNSTGSFVLKMRIRSSDPITPHINASNSSVEGSGVYTVKGVNADGTAFVSEVNKWQDVYVPFTLNKGATKVTHCLMYLGGNKSIASYYDENGNVVDYVDLAAYAFFNTMDEAKAYNFVVGEKIEDVKAVYISANGDDANSGRHSTLPVKTLARADAIFEAAGNEAVDTLYVIGSTTPYTIVKEGKDTAAEISFGTTAKTIKIRGYNGKSDVFYPTDSHFAFDGALDFDNITIKQGGGDGKFMAQGHDFVAGENVAVEGAKNFSNFYYGKKGNHGYGTSSTNLANATAIFNGGSWGNVHGGFWTGGTYSGNTTIIVDGATLSSIKNGHGSGTNQYFKGDFRVDVESGSVGAINLDSSTDNAINSYAGVRYFTLNGGAVTGDITVTSKNVSKDGKLTKSADSGYTIVEINSPNVLKGSIVQGKADDDAERIVIYNNNSYVAGQVKDVKAKVIIPVGGTLTANASSTINSSGTVTTVFDTYSYTADASVNTIKINDVRYPVSHFEAGKIPNSLFVSGENRVEFLTLEEELVHSDRMQAYIDAGYNVVYVSANGADGADGATIATPKKADSFAAALNAAVTENGKAVIVLIGEIKANATVPNDVDGADVIITSATGANGTNGGYLNFYATNNEYDTILPKGESTYTFDNIYIKVNSSKQDRIYASGANIKLTSSVKSNTTTSKSLTIAHGRDSADAFTGGTFDIDTSLYLLRSGAGTGNNITGDIIYNIGENAVVGLIGAGGHAGNSSGTDAGTLKGSAYVNVNGGILKDINPGYMATVNGDVIVNVNDGGKIESLKTTCEGDKGVINGDYVTYLNNGTIEKVEKKATPASGKGVKGKTILIVNDNNADVPASISNLPYLVSFTGSGAVHYDTATDKLVIAPADGAKYVKVTNGDTVKTYNTNGDGVTLAGEFSVDLASGTTTVEFLTEGTELFTITFVDGDTTETQTVTAGTVPTAPAWTKDGFVLGWDKEIVAATASVTYNAVWKSSESDVVFNAGAGAFADGTNTYTVKVAPGATIPTPENPTRSGYTFRGWDTPIGTLETDGATFNAVWDINHVADYIEAGYEVVYVSSVANGSGDGSTSENSMADLQAVFTAKANVPKLVVAFVGGFINKVDPDGDTAAAYYDHGADQTIVLTSGDGTSLYFGSNINFKDNKHCNIIFDNIDIVYGGNYVDYNDTVADTITEGDRYISVRGNNLKFTETVTMTPAKKADGTARKAAFIIHPLSDGGSFSNTVPFKTEIFGGSNLYVRGGGYNGSSSNVGYDLVVGGSAKLTTLQPGGHTGPATISEGSKKINGNINVVMKGNAQATTFNSNGFFIVNGDIITTVEENAKITTVNFKCGGNGGKINGDSVLYVKGGTVGTVTGTTDGGTIRAVVTDTSVSATPTIGANVTHVVNYNGNLGTAAINTATDKLVVTPASGAKYVRITNGTTVTEYNVSGDEVSLMADVDLTALPLSAGTTTVEFLADGTEGKTVTFVNDGETVQTGLVAVGTVPTAPVLTKTGYTLSWDKEIVAVTEAVTYTAVWTANHIVAYREAGCEIVYVSVDGAGTNDGSNSANAYATLPEAMEANATIADRTVVYALVDNYYSTTSINATKHGSNQTIIITSGDGTPIHLGGQVLFKHNANCDIIFDNIEIIYGGTYDAATKHEPTGILQNDRFIAANGNNLTIEENVVITPATFNGVTRKADLIIYAYGEGVIHNSTKAPKIEIKSGDNLQLRAGGWIGSKSSAGVEYIVSGNAKISTAKPGGHNAGDTDITDEDRTLSGDLIFTIKDNAEIDKFVLNGNYIYTGNAIVKVEGGKVGSMAIKCEHHNNNAIGYIKKNTVVYYTGGEIASIVDGNDRAGAIRALVADIDVVTMPTIAEDSALTHIVKYNGDLGTTMIDTETGKLVLTPTSGAKYIRVTNGTNVKEYNVNGNEVTLADEFSVDLAEGTTTVEFLTDGTETKKITFVDGEETVSEALVAVGTVPTAPVLTKTGYTLSWDKEIVAVTEAVTYNAVWEANTYTITYYVDGTEYKTVTYAYGAEVTMESAPEKDGYTFSGWDKTITTMPAENVTVNGTFTKDEEPEITGAIYKTYGVYDVEAGTYTVELKLYGVKANAGSFGFVLPGLVSVTPAEGITLFAETGSAVSPIFAKDDNHYANTWAIEGGTGNIDATVEEVLIATFVLNATSSFPEKFVEYVVDNADEKYHDGEHYLVTPHIDNSLETGNKAPVIYAAHSDRVEEPDFDGVKFTTKGTYDPTKNQYSIEIYVEGKKINLGAFGLAFNSEYMTFDPEAEESVKLADGIANYLDIVLNNTADGYAFVFDGSSKLEGYIDATNGAVLIATITVGMTADQRTAFENAGKTMNIFVPAESVDGIEKYFDFTKDAYIASLYTNDLDIPKVATVYASHTDEALEPSTADLKVKVDFTARDGEGIDNAVIVLNDVEYNLVGTERTFSGLEIGKEYTVEVKKNGYLAASCTITLDASAELTFSLIAGDIKGSAEAICGDGVVDLSDFVRLIRAFDASTSEEFKESVDLNEDGNVNVADLSIIKANYDKTSEDTEITKN